MRKIQVNPLIAAVVAVFLSVSGFGAGYATQYLSTIGQPVQIGDYAGLGKLETILKERFDGEIDPQKLLEGAKAGLVSSAGDPYTVYLTAQEAQQLEDDLNGKLTGIGAEIGIRDGQLIVVAPIDDTPADQAGLKPKDAILEIDGTDTQGMSVAQAVTKIRGEEGTQVSLRIGRPGREPFEVTITRALINVPSVKWEMKDGYGYIKVSRFGSDTVSRTRQAARELEAQGANGIILDMRSNPGGFLDASVGVASVFLEKGKEVVEERKGGETIESLKAEGNPLLQGMRTAVLINGGSASASEIVAGALQDHQAGTVIGEKSFGKGSVQDLVELAGGGQLKVTIAHWFTPKGRDITKDGIKPDIEIELTNEDFDNDRDPQLDRAIEFLSK